MKQYWVTAHSVNFVVEANSESAAHSKADDLLANVAADTMSWTITSVTEYQPEGN